MDTAPSHLKGSASLIVDRPGLSGRFVSERLARGFSLLGTLSLESRVRDLCVELVH
jgi:hypothetical protein